jgi:hypothetical protein
MFVEEGSSREAVLLQVLFLKAMPHLIFWPQDLRHVMRLLREEVHHF